MSNLFTIIITKASTDLTKALEQCEQQWQVNGIDKQCVSLQVFFITESVVQLSMFSDKFLTMVKVKNYPIQFKVCSTALERRNLDKAALVISYNSILTLSSLAQLADSCLNSTAWVFDDSDLLIDKDIIDSQKAPQLTCRLSSLAQQTDQELMFTEFLDVVMTFASFDFKVKAIFSYEAGLLWLDNDSIDGLLSWRKQCLALKPVYGVDTIVVESVGYNASSDAIIYLGDVDIIINDINDYVFPRQHYLSW